MFKRIQRAEEFSNQIGEIFGTIEKGKTRNVTFVVTEQCSLRCTYCYQCNKSSKRMTFDVAKRFIDMLFDTDDGSVLANIIEFIGGEPFLEIDLITQICEYWDYKCIMTEHRWGSRTIFNFSSNGMNYHEPKVQEFMKKYHKRVSINITIDGDKELHDSCRVTPDGKGSYDIAHSNAELHKNLYGADSMGSKITIAPENLKYLFKAIKHYIVSDNAYDINANTVFEEGWGIDHAKLFYQELKKIADFMIDNDYEDRYLSLFQENGFSPQSEKDNQCWCGGDGSMLALGTDGKIFPCIRYMSYSLGKDVKELDCGNLDDGIDKDKLGELQKMTRRSLSTDECYYCPVAKLCAYCLAYNFQVYGTPNKRTIFTCGMHKARSLGNVYYWNRIYKKHNIQDRFKRWLSDDESLKIIDQDELELLNSLENQFKNSRIINDIEDDHNR